MLKKVRWRFIGSAMAAFTAVILILLLVLNTWNYRSVSHQQDDALQMLLNTENGGETPPEKPNGAEPPEAPDGTQLPAALPPDSWRQFSREVQYSFRYFSVRYDADGTQEGVNCTAVASITEEEAAAYSDTVLAGGKTSGYYAGYRFRVQSTADSTTVIFLNSERELQAVRSLLLLTIAIACGCLLGVFALVLLFSRRAIAPYLRNLSVQKQFITNAGHELKTPLTAISTSADVLAMEYPGDEWAENIQAQSARLARLIEDLVTLSRLDEENPFPEKTEFSLSDAVWEITEPFSSLVAAKGKRYSQEIEDGVLLTGERQAVQQMSPFCWTMPSNTPTRAAKYRSASPRQEKGHRYMCSTPAPAQRALTFPGSSTGFTARTSRIPAPSAARASACPLPERPPRPTAAASAPRSRSAASASRRFCEYAKRACAHMDV